MTQPALPRLAFAIALGALGLALVPTEAAAGGFFHVENGAEALGRGGAFHAKVDDASAVYFNPANLAKLDGFSVVLAANLSFLQTTFTRDGLDQRVFDENGDTVDNANFGERLNTPYETVERECETATLCTPAGFIAPMLFLGYGGKDWGVAVGAWGPPGLGASDYPEDGAQRYQLLSAGQSLIWFGAGGAYQVGPVRFGATLIVGNLNVLFKLMADANPSPQISGSSSRSYRGESSSQFNQVFDLPFELTTSAWSAAGILGVAWDIIPELTLAVSTQTQTRFESEGTLSIEFTDAIPPSLATLSDDRVSLAVNLPWLVRIGLLWTYELEPERPLFDLELDITYESWSINDELRLKVPGGLGDGDAVTPIGDIILKKKWQDTVGARLGGSFYAFDWWEVLLGGYFETGAVPSETTSLDNFSWNRVGVSVGSVFKTPFGLDVALAYGHIFQPERTIDDSQVRVTVPLSQCVAPYTGTLGDVEASDVCPVQGEPPGDSVGNGTYDADFDIVSLTLRYNY